MFGWIRIAGLAAALSVYATGISAQIPAAPGARASHWELNLHAATLLDNLFESSGQAYQAGVRVLRHTDFGVGFGGNFDYVRTSDVLVAPGLAGLQADLLLYSVEVDYSTPVTSRADFFAGAGIGGATVRFSDVAVAPSNFAESSTGQLIPLAIGFKIKNREVDPSWAFRFDVRDNIIFLNTFDPEGGEEGSEPRSNWELSAGISFLFGDGPERGARARPGDRQPQPVRDSDRDGIVDGRDRCPNTPFGAETDAFGCPVAPAARPDPAAPRDADRDGVPDRAPAAQLDTDGDGVRDVDDRCGNTPLGVRVDARGCPVPVDADGDGVVGERDRCPGTPAGVPVDANGCPVPVDTDRDGVVDAEDRCVNTPPGTRVDSRGCPVPTDEDDDGVLDRMDRCPRTPAGVAVDADGCPVRAEPEDETPAAPPGPAAQPGPAAAACVDARAWYRGGSAIQFADRQWVPFGNPEPITENNLQRVGSYDGIPIFVGVMAAQPYSDLWLPRCDPGGTFQLYIQPGSDG